MQINNCKGLLLASLLAGSFFQAEASVGASDDKAVPVAKAGATSHLDGGNAARNFAGNRQSLYFKRNWGVEVIGVHPVSSGYMLDFRYRIVDPAKAKMINDLKSKAYIVDVASGTRLAVPAMENVGELRTGSDPKTDRNYFMIFGNPGRLVKPGSQVNVVIGNFHVDGLIVN